MRTYIITSNYPRIDIMKNPDIVRVSNKLNTSVQKLSLSEKRLLMLIISKVTDESIDSEIETKATEYATAYGTDKSSAYRTVKSAHDKLWDRNLIMDGKRRRWLITGGEYEEGEGRIISRIHPDIRDHVFDLKQRYTQYFLRRAGEFKSVYSWRLFEQLMQFRKTGLYRKSVADFKVLLDIPEGYGKDFSIIRQRVLNIALKEIRATGLPVKLKTIKKGRTVHMLEFTFPLEQQADWISKQSISQTQQEGKRVTKKYIEQHARPGESYEEARQRLERKIKQSKEAQEVK